MRNIRNCTVAVVGGAGFLGSHLVDHLIEDRGCKVLVVDNLISGRREFVHKDAIFEHHDITTSEGHLKGLFKLYDVKHVFSYAAHPYIPLSFERPKYVAETNFIGAINVINAAQEAGCEAILQVSSAEIYGDGNGVTWESPSTKAKGGYSSGEEHDAVEVPVALAEDAPVRPHSTYGAAKAAVDYYVQCGWRERKTPCIALRQFNCVGPRETHPYIVPEIISQIAKQDGDYPPNSVVVRLGNNSFRDFLYAGDQAKIAVELLERGKFGEVYNLGSETGTKIYDLAKLIGKLMGFADVRVEQDPKRVRPWEIWHLQSDNTKLEAALWIDGKEQKEKGKDCLVHPLTTLEEALKRTIAYYRENNNQWCWEK
jgi:nucleoside-diphosphate-sugar epimerase